MTERVPSGPVPAEKKKKIKVAIVETTASAEDRARDVAERKLNEDVARGGLWKRIWKNNLAYDYYRQKAIVKERATIHEKKNLFADESDDRAAHERAMQAVVKQFTDELAPQLVHEQAGEKRAVLATPEDLALRDKVKLLVMEYATKDLNDPAIVEAFQIERAKIIDDLGTAKADVFDEKIGNRRRMFADNLLETAKAVQASIAHGEALSDLDLDFDVVVGRARAGVRTEVQLDRVDKIVEKLQQGKLGMLMNETTLAGGVAIAYLVTAGLSKRVASSRLAAWGTFGATAALTAGFAWGKERRRMEKDRAMHSRERAEGREKPTGQKRREELEERRYETKTAAELTQNMEMHLRLLQLQMPPGMTVEARLKQVHDAFLALKDTESRIEKSDRESIDLIAFTDAKNVVAERYALDVARAQLNVELKKIADTEPDVSALITTEKDQWLEEARGSKTALEIDIEKKNKLFEALKSRNAFKAARNAALIGLGFGVIAQEAVAALREDQAGLVEQLWSGKSVKPPEHMTAAEWLRVLIVGKESYELTGGPETRWIGSNQIHMPEGFAFVGGSLNSFDLMRNGKLIASGITTDYDGIFTPKAHEILKQHGIVMSVPQEHLEDTASRVTKYTEVSEPGPPKAPIPTEVPRPPVMRPMSMEDWLAARAEAEDTHQIKREMWMDNDTPKFDKNELRLRYGGLNDTGINKNGDYEYSVRALMEKGSYHGKTHINAREMMKTGQLKMLLSASKGSQNMVFEVAIDTKGRMIVEQGSEAAKLFRVNPTTGKSEFIGGFMEVAQKVGVKNGLPQMRILATEVGLDRAGSAMPMVPQPQPALPPQPSEEPEMVKRLVPKVEMEVTPRRWTDTNLRTVADPTVDPPPFIPILGRRPLEQAPVKKEGGFAGYGYYGSNSAENILKDFHGRNIPLDTYTIVEKDGKKIFLDKEGNPIRRDTERERQRIKEYLDKQDPEYLKTLERENVALPLMAEQCRVAVIIPARFEAHNLPNLLDQYWNQVDEKGQRLDPDMFEINIIINRRDSETADNSMEVIKQWKATHPTVRVNAVDVALDKEHANVGYARKYITDLTLMRSLARNSQTKPLYIETEDADMEAIDRRTIGQLVKGFDEQPHVDVLRGIQDRQPEELIRNDVLFFARRLWDFGEVFMRSPKYRPGNNPHADFVWNRVISGGWNTAYTAESYAQIGGYASKLIGEDMDIGQKISVLRGSTNNEGTFVPNTWTAKASGLRMSSSPRRFIMALADNKGPYDDFEDQSLKKLSMDQLFARIDSYKKASLAEMNRYQDQINYLSNFVRERSGPNQQAWREVMTRTLWYSGLREGKEYEITGQQIRLKNEGMEKLIDTLEKYKKASRWKLGYRRQNNRLGV